MLERRECQGSWLRQGFPHSSSGLHEGVCFSSDCMAVLGFAWALSSREHGSTSGKIGGALLGKIPCWSCGSSSAAAHLALPRWKEPPRPSSGSASSKHCVLYARAWVRLSNAFHRALAEMFHQSTKSLVHFFCPCTRRVMKAGSFFQS